MKVRKSISQPSDFEKNWLYFTLGGIFTVKQMRKKAVWGTGKMPPKKSAATPSKTGGGLFGTLGRTANHAEKIAENTNDLTKAVADTTKFAAERARAIAKAPVDWFKKIEPAHLDRAKLPDDVENMVHEDIRRMDDDVHILHDHENGWMKMFKNDKFDKRFTVAQKKLIAEMYNGSIEHIEKATKEFHTVMEKLDEIMQEVLHGEIEKARKNEEAARKGWHNWWGLSPSGEVKCACCNKYIIQ